MKLELALPLKGPLSCLISCHLPPPQNSNQEVKSQPHSLYRIHWIHWAGKASVFKPSYWKLIIFSEAWKDSFKKLTPQRHLWNGKPPGWRCMAHTCAFLRSHLCAWRGALGLIEVCRDHFTTSHRQRQWKSLPVLGLHLSHCYVQDCAWNV